METFSAEFDRIPIGNLYTPSPKRPRRAAASASTSTSTSNPGDYITAGAVLREFAAKKVDEGQSTGPVSMSLADPDLFDCPVCYEPLSSPVYQCENGHIACGSCCNTILKNNCSNCCLPIENIRCRAVEKIIESVIVTCQYKPYGCTEMFSYNKKRTHEKSCNYAPCSCPCAGCDFVGLPKRLYEHFDFKHKDSSEEFYFNAMVCMSMDSTVNHVILREREGGELFVLNRCIDTLGSFYNVVCVAPSASEKRFMYELSASFGENLFKVETCVEMISKWTPQGPAKMSLFVPSNLISTSQVFSLCLIISKKHALADCLFHNYNFYL